MLRWPIRLHVGLINTNIGNNDNYFWKCCQWNDSNISLNTKISSSSQEDIHSYGSPPSFQKIKNLVDMYCYSFLRMRIPPCIISLISILLMKVSLDRRATSQSMALSLFDVIWLEEGEPENLVIDWARREFEVKNGHSYSKSLD